MKAINLNWALLSPPPLIALLYIDRALDPFILNIRVVDLGFSESLELFRLVLTELY